MCRQRHAVAPSLHGPNTLALKTQLFFHTALQARSQHDTISSNSVSQSDTRVRQKRMCTQQPCPAENWLHEDCRAGRVMEGGSSAQVLAAGLQPSSAGQGAGVRPTHP